MPLRTPPTPSPRCRRPLRWNVAYDVCRDQHGRSLPGGPSKTPPQRARSATGTLYRSCHAHGLDTTPARTQIRPRYQLHAQHATPPTSPRRRPAHYNSSAVYCCRRLRLPYSPAPPSPPPARAMVVPHRRRRLYRFLPRQMYLQQVPLSPIHTHAGRTLNTARTTPRARSSDSRSPSPAPRLSPPTRRHRVQLLITILRSKPAPVRHREYDAQHRRSAQQVQRASPVARAAFIAPPCAATILCAHAALRSKPRPAAHRERDVHHPRRVTLRPSPSPRNLPASHVHPQRHSAPLVADSATPRPMGSTPRGGFHRLRASSGRTTRRRYAPRASAVPASRAKDF
ncbi:hypothetical protein B0H14DRAFT_1157469 [Mycena olivaceomarginata]|nr:hypothetical protein B0H14DRAFT_1157469 [Mycena olivaceomarginata]